MPSGVYVRKYKRKLSEETKRKIGLAHRGKKHSEKAKKKMSRSAMGKKLSDKTRSKIGKWSRGFIRTQEHCRKISESRRGKNNPNWRGGRTTLKQIIRHCQEYKQWRKAVFERDNYTCQRPGCGKRGGFLNADHFVMSFSRILSENKISSLEEALKCKELWDINNGRTLCLECHKKTETYLKNNKKYTYVETSRIP